MEIIEFRRRNCNNLHFTGVVFDGRISAYGCVKNRAELVWIVKSTYINVFVSTRGSVRTWVVRFGLCRCEGILNLEQILREESHFSW